VLTNAVARELYWWQQTDATAAEVFVTDARGRVIASSGRTSDDAQADEEWWQKAYADGKGRVYISQVSFDESARVWAVAIAVPVVADTTPRTRVVGVLKAELDVGRLFQDVTRAGMSGIDRALLVDGQGRIVVSSVPTRPLARTLRNPSVSRLQDGHAEYLVDRSEDALLAWSPVPLDRLADQGEAAGALYVVTRRSAAEAFGPLRRVQAWMLAIGFVTIAVTVAVGYYLADVLVVRQIRTLALGMRDLAGGDFVHARAVADRLLDGNGMPEERVEQRDGRSREAVLVERRAGYGPETPGEDG
jgi:hypothetical protein